MSDSNYEGKHRKPREIKPVHSEVTEETTGFFDKNTMMTLGAFGLLAAAGFYMWRENQKNR
jgi:hypothetical protein